MSKLGFVKGRAVVMRQALLLFVCGFGLALPSAGAQEPAEGEPAVAQTPTLSAEDENEALRAFTRGNRAYEEGEYEVALQSFEEAYRLGGQGEVQYNIGMAAERVGQNEKALAAYRAYLELLEEPPLELQAQSRIRALLFSGVEPDSSVAVTYQATEPYEPEDLPKRKRAVIGPVIFMTLGLAGLGAMTAGFVKDGKCVNRDSFDRCTEVAELNLGPTIAYGSIGGALLLSGALWIGLSGRTNTVFGLGPGTLQLKGTF